MTDVRILNGETVAVTVAPVAVTVVGEGSGQTAEQVDIKIAVHVNDPTPHPGAVSGRDFAAAYLNRLV